MVRRQNIFECYRVLMSTVLCLKGCSPAIGASHLMQVRRLGTVEFPGGGDFSRNDRR